MSDCPTPIVNYQEDFELEAYPLDLISACVTCARSHTCLLELVRSYEQVIMLLRLMSLDIHQLYQSEWEQPAIMKCLMSLAKEGRVDFQCIGHFMP